MTNNLMKNFPLVTVKASRLASAKSLERSNGKWREAIGPQPIHNEIISISISARNTLTESNSALKGIM